MATFVERAVLELTDKTSGKSRKINSELRKLFTTANKIKRTFGRINTSGLSNLTQKLRTANRNALALNKTMQQLRAGRNTPLVDTASLNKALVKARALNAQLAKANAVGSPVAVGDGSGRPRNRPQGGNNRPNATVAANSNVRASRGASAIDIGKNIATRMVIATAVMNVASATINAIGAGTKAADVADNRLDELGLTKLQTKRANDFAAEQSSENQVTSKAFIKSLIGEVFTSTGGDLAATLEIVKQALPLATAAVARGVDGDVARDDLDVLLRSAEQAGRFNKEDGTPDKEKIAQFIKLQKQASIQLGEQYDPKKIAQLFKALGNIKMSLDDRGLMNALISFEERGVSAGTGTSQLVKNISGQSTKKEVTKFLASKGILNKDSDLLFSNPEEWIAKHAVPVLRDMGIDPNNAQEVAKASPLFASRAAAKDSFVSAVVRRQERLRDVDFATKLQVDKDVESVRFDKSSNVSLESAKVQMISAIGEITNSLESVFNPALRGVANIANAIATFAGGGNTPEEQRARGMATLMGAAIAAALAGAGAKKLLGKFGLKTSAVALTGSATQLNMAAAALQRAAVAQTATGRRGGGAVGDVGGGGKAKPAAKGKLKGVGLSGPLGLAYNLFINVKDLDKTDIAQELKRIASLPKDQQDAAMAKLRKERDDKSEKQRLGSNKVANDLISGIAGMLGFGPFKPFEEKTPAQVREVQSRQMIADALAAEKNKDAVNQDKLPELQANRQQLAEQINNLVASIERQKANPNAIPGVIAAQETELAQGRADLAAITANIESAKAAMESTVGNLRTEGASTVSSLSSSFTIGSGTVAGAITNALTTGGDILASKLSAAAANVSVNVAPTPRPAPPNGAINLASE